MEHVTMVQMTLSANGVVSKTMQNSLKLLNMNEGNFIFENGHTLRKYLTASVIITDRIFNPLQPKRRPLYLKTQSVPRCKHFSSLL